MEPVGVHSDGPVAGGLVLRAALRLRQRIRYHPAGAVGHRAVGLPRRVLHYDRLPALAAAESGSGGHRLCWAVGPRDARSRNHLGLAVPYWQLRLRRDRRRDTASVGLLRADWA